jgi:hypothetical protein
MWMPDHELTFSGCCCQLWSARDSCASVPSEAHPNTHKLSSANRSKEMRSRECSALRYELHWIDLSLKPNSLPHILECPYQDPRNLRAIFAKCIHGSIRVMALFLDTDNKIFGILRQLDSLILALASLPAVWPCTLPSSRCPPEPL